MLCAVAYQGIFFRSFKLLLCSEKFSHQGTLPPMSLRSYLCFARMVVLSSIFLCDNTVGSPDPYYCRVCSEFWAIKIVNFLGLNKSTREINFLAVTSHRQQFIICTLVDAIFLYALRIRRLLPKVLTRKADYRLCLCDKLSCKKIFITELVKKKNVRVRTFFLREIDLVIPASCACY